VATLAKGVAILLGLLQGLPKLVELLAYGPPAAQSPAKALVSLGLPPSPLMVGRLNKEMAGRTLHRATKIEARWVWLAPGTFTAGFTTEPGPLQEGASQETMAPQELPLHSPTLGQQAGNLLTDTAGLFLIYLNIPI